MNHPNQYFDESRQVLQEGQGSSRLAGSAAPSGLGHGKVTVKNELNSTPDTNVNNDIGDIQMDDDDDMLGEIEGMETMA